MREEDMFVGNAPAREMIQQFFHALQTGKTVFPFLLLSGRAHVGKTTLIEEEVHKMLGSFFASDYIALYDLSELLAKEQSIKIETPRGEEYTTIGEQAYCTWGIREINQRLSRAPLGQRKVVYLENIERMTLSAANALLKSFEEPLPGRLIIASTTGVERLLDTIRSRALHIPFHLVTSEEIDQAIKTTYPTLSPQTQKFVTAFSLGARGLIEKLLASPNITEWVEQYTAVEDRFAHPTIIQEQMNRLLWIKDQGQLEQLIDALLYAGSGSADLLVQIKKFLQSNIKVDHILFRWCLEHLRKKNEHPYEDRVRTNSL